ncbi:hypothetical protein EBU58_15700 [bacterium]|nr:hypothetical protein [bacterium]
MALWPQTEIVVGMKQHLTKSETRDKKGATETANCLFLSHCDGGDCSKMHHGRPKATSMRRHAASQMCIEGLDRARTSPE